MPQSANEISAGTDTFPFPHILYAYTACLALSIFIHGMTYVGAALTELSFMPGLAEPLSLIALTYLPDLWTEPTSFGGSFTVQAGLKSILTVWALLLLIKKLFEAYKKGFTAKEAFKPFTAQKIAKFCIKAAIICNLMFPASFVLTTDYKNTSLNIVEFFGIGLWIYGCIVYVTSAIQKWIFKKKYPGDFVTTGLWKYCRYPDLHGELVMWLGLFVIASLKLNIFCTLLMLALCPAVCITNICLFEGGIKSKDKIAEEKYGHRQDYIIYKHGTYPIFPKFKSADTNKSVS